MQNILSFNEQLGYKKQPQGFATKAIHAAQNPKIWSSRAVVPPIVTSATYLYEDVENLYGIKYSRYGSPTRSVLEEALASLDEAKYGLTFATGAAAITAVITTLASGDGLITTKELYGGSMKLFDSLAVKMGIEVTYVDFNDLKGLTKALKPNTKIVWIESPSNPLLSVFDLKAIGEVVHKNSKALLVVDNTFLTSYYQRPLELGADAVMYSLSKFTNGHTDVVMGAIVTNNEEFHESLKFYQAVAGLVPSSFDCYLVIRSLKTLPTRMEQHSKNSYLVAKFLQAHPRVKQVMHPALKTHPGHEIALAQSYGHSGIIGFLIDGTLEQSKVFLKELKLIKITQSLGCVSSSVSFPWAMQVGFMPEKKRLETGITDNLIRFSVGIEDVNEIIDELDRALNATDNKRLNAKM